MADSISKIPALEYYNKVKSDTLKDLMDILSNRNLTKAGEDVNLKGESQKLQDQSVIPQVGISDIQDTKVLVSSLKKLMDLTQLFLIKDKSLEIMISQKAIPQEIEGQHRATVLYKGAFFDVLREIVHTNPDNDIVKNAVTDLLKAFLSQSANDNTQKNVHSAFKDLDQLFLQNNDKDFSGKVNNLITKNLYSIDLNEIVNLAKDILTKYPEDVKVQSYLKEIVQIFSNIDNNKETLAKAVDDLINLLDDAQKNQVTLKNKLIEMLGLNSKPDIHNIKENLTLHLFNNTQLPEKMNQDAVVLEKMLSFIENNIDKMDLNEAFKGASEQIIKNILVGQNFKSPMLHFALPVQYEGLNAFGELWIDANGDNEGQNSEKKNRGIRVLLVIDIADVGIFEVDILLEGKKLSTRLYCPPELIALFSDAEGAISIAASKAGLYTSTVEVMEFKRVRTLDEVFQKPIERRNGIDVRV